MEIFKFLERIESRFAMPLFRFTRMGMVLACLLIFSQTASAQLFPTFINNSFTLGNATGSSPYALDDTFLLETNPGAAKTIYLDFDGHHSVNNDWDHNLNFQAFDLDGNASDFSDFELIQIQRQFQNVAEDFIGFDVNVTTRDPGMAALTKSDNSDQTYGVRSVNSESTGGFFSGTGGVAILGSFDSSTDTPVFAFNEGENVGAMTNSHEIGHALGLSHDGLGGQNYHPGTGSGATSWGPLMGAPFSANVTQWSNGDYTGATNTEDDLAIITNSTNGINYREDDFGNDISTAASVTIDAAGDAFVWGVVEQNTDIDFFEFDLGRGEFILEIDPFQGRPNLDILAVLYDSNGDMIETSNPFDDLNAGFQVNIDAAGSYFLSIEGTGNAGVYSDYGSLGFFTVNGSFTAVPEPVGIGMFACVTMVMIGRRRNRTCRLDG